jgi:3-isopropylmalate dehydratase small subunit
LIWPGGTLVSTDSHANIMGAIGAFGQGMGDVDVAGAFAHGSVWFEVPPTVRVLFEGQPSREASPKDLALAAVGRLEASGLLGRVAEVYGDAIEQLDMDGRVTVASMATEMGAVTAMIPPDERVVDFCRERAKRDFEPFLADPGASYEREITIDVSDLRPLVARPGRPDDVTSVEELAPTVISSAFIGSCTNGWIQDMRAAARVLQGRKTPPWVVLKIVPATDRVWRQCLDEGLLSVFKGAGAIVANAGCAGCASGQVGQVSAGEVSVSTSNRNYPGKQGGGSVFLASPATVAASAIAGSIITAERLASGDLSERPTVRLEALKVPRREEPRQRPEQPGVLSGRVWAVDVDDVDTDMIFHNRHLAVTDPAEMGKRAFGNLEGWQDFPERASRGDIIFVGHNFGCGSSRQQAVDCFRSLGIGAIVGRSFGAIYKRNAINAALPLLTCDWSASDLQTGEELRIDLASGKIENVARATVLQGSALSEIQLQIYRRGGLLARGEA